MVLAASLPSSPRISVSTTMTRLPMCSGWLCALTGPDRGAAQKKLVLDSMVAVPPAPSGRFRNAHTAPEESARAITIPPCRTSLPVHRLGAQSTLSTTSFGSALSAVMPSVTPSGTSEWIISVAAESVTCSASHCLQCLGGGRVGGIERPDRHLGNRHIQRRADNRGHAEERQLISVVPQTQRHGDVSELGPLGLATRVGRQLGKQFGQPRVEGGLNLAVQPFEDMCPPLRQIGDARCHAAWMQ